MTDRNLQVITKAIACAKDFTNDVIEATVIEYVCKKAGKPFSYRNAFSGLENAANPDLLAALEEMHFPVDMECIIEFFEALLEKENVTENGIVFTPRYIADYINDCALKDMDGEQVKSLDPGCGCGISLVSAAEKLKQKSKRNLVEIVNESIFGIEVDADNARRCKIVLHLFVVLSGESNEKLTPHIFCGDSLKTDWREVFQVEGFDCITGNPPYVNTHDMTKETAQFLKENFQTTKTGVYNIFYAFVEYGMEFLKDTGVLSYIVPNNFLTIKSAADLRKLLAGRKWLEKIIDFADNMVFKPVRTYNCIIQLSKMEKEQFAYAVMEKTDQIPERLLRLQLNQMQIGRLDPNGWNLVDRQTMANVRRIEGQSQCIKEFVRTGIATLRDEIYTVAFDGESYYKDVEGTRYAVEKNLVKRLYKIPDLKQCKDLSAACRYIIFPYQKGKNGFEIIPEEELKKKNPKTYAYLLARKAELDKRDKGKDNPVAWYAYGRTQGLNKYGKKLVFPTFASKPRFTMVADELALFCNGYAVFENDFLDLDILQRILNSTVMQYYVRNTSYAIEGGYYCYQKKYIEKFSLPVFSEEEKKRMMELDGEELDGFLVEKYGLDFGM